MKKLLCMTLLLASLLSFAQASKSPQTSPSNQDTTQIQIQEEPVYSPSGMDRLPEFPGGLASMYQFIQKNLRYPAEASKANIQGRVFVGFIVGSNGSVQDVKIQKGIGYGCDEEAIRVVKAMPLWKPGVQDGKNVAVRYSLPFKFDFTQETVSPSKDTTSKKDEPVYIVTEKMPEFPGGVVAMDRFIGKNLQYPPEAKAAKIEGRVFVVFVVGQDGTLRDLSIAKGIGYGCDEEAIRLIQAMPKWIPGMQNGKTVSVRYAVPIQFTLTDQ